MDVRSMTKTILGRVLLLDPRMPEISSAMIDAWADVFRGRVWPDEGLAAVREHYSVRGAFVIMAGDIVDYCQRQPPWSSREHATDFVRRLRDYPHTPLIEHYSGETPPGPDEYASWLDANEQSIVTMIVAMKSRPPVS